MGLRDGENMSDLKVSEDAYASECQCIASGEARWLDLLYSNSLDRVTNFSRLEDVLSQRAFGTDHGTYTSSE
jgi:hypothetical protein